MSDVRLSVVVPAYNEAGYLADSLNSLQHQDFAGTYEVIVVDNNSTDTTATIARHHGARVVHERVPASALPVRQELMLPTGRSSSPPTPTPSIPATG